jgi:hypothetical protein
MAPAALERLVKIDSRGPSTTSWVLRAEGVRIGWATIWETRLRARTETLKNFMAIYVEEYKDDKDENVNIAMRNMAVCNEWTSRAERVG